MQIYRFILDILMYPFFFPWFLMLIAWGAWTILGRLGRPRPSLAIMLIFSGGILITFISAWFNKSQKPPPQPYKASGVPLRWFKLADCPEACYPVLSLPFFVADVIFWFLVLFAAVNMLSRALRAR